jgi:hypothetical protein
MEEQLLEIIQGIMEIINLKGEDATDGECLDMIVKFLTANGYDIETEIP